MASLMILLLDVSYLQVLMASDSWLVALRSEMALDLTGARRWHCDLHPTSQSSTGAALRVTRTHSSSTPSASSTENVTSTVP